MRTLSNAPLLALLLVSVGCSIVEAPLPEHAEEITSEQVAIVDPLPPPAVQEAPPDACEHPSLTSPPDESVEQSLLREAACLEETFGDDGCPDTRVTRSFDSAGRVSKEVFEVLDPSLNAYTYVPIASHVRTFRYDDAGHVLLEETDELLDGSVDARVSRVYDEAGRLRQQSEDLPWGGSEHKTFDEEGRELEVVFESEDGSHWTTVRTFTSDGRPLLDETTTDVPGQEDYLQRTTWSYDDDGRPLSSVREVDSGSGASSVSTLTWFYEGGVAVRTEERSIFRGYAYQTADRVVISELDERGNAIRVLEDQSEDGVIDAIATYTFDAGDRKTSELHTDGSGGIVYQHQTFSFDDEGRLVESRWLPTSGLYGTTSTWTERRSYDDAGLLASVELSQDDVRSSMTTFRYDRLGQPTLETTDWGADGSVEQERRWERDAQGNLLSTSFTDERGTTLRSRLGYGCFDPAL